MSKYRASFHFNSLAHDNSATSHSVQGIQHIPNDRGDGTPSHTLLTGRQQVAKYNRTASDDIQVFMALYRIEDKNVDLVLTMNVPIVSADGGAVQGPQPTRDAPLALLPPLSRPRSAPRARLHTRHVGRHDPSAIRHAHNYRSTIPG